MLGTCVTASHSTDGEMARVPEPGELLLPDGAALLVLGRVQPASRVRLHEGGDGLVPALQLGVEPAAAERPVHQPKRSQCATVRPGRCQSQSSVYHGTSSDEGDDWRVKRQTAAITG